MSELQQIENLILLAICIPTANRPEQLERLLLNLTEQSWLPDYVLVVDSSQTDKTELLCQCLKSKLLPIKHLRYERCARGLTRQRLRGIEILQELRKEIRYVCMLDDDVFLAPDFLEKIIEFMESAEGRHYGGVSGYEMLGTGKPFNRLQKLYHKLKIYDGNLRPGRWLYCGEFLELSRLKTFRGVYKTEFLLGCAMVFRTEVFHRVLPSIELPGFRGGEDKHLTLRVATFFKLGIVGEAHFGHYHVSGGARPNKFMSAYLEMRNKAHILNDCDPNPSLKRYLAFLIFNFMHLCVRLLFMVYKFDIRQLPHFGGSLIGWLHCILRPPKPTTDSLCVLLNNTEDANSRGRK